MLCVTGNTSVPFGIWCESAGVSGEVHRQTHGVPHELIVPVVRVREARRLDRAPAEELLDAASGTEYEYLDQKGMVCIALHVR